MPEVSLIAIVGDEGIARQLLYEYDPIKNSVVWFYIYKIDKSRWDSNHGVCKDGTGVVQLDE